MRLGVIVEGDQFVYKTDKWKIDWRKAACWPFTPDEVEEGHAFFINTRSNQKRLQVDAMVFERPAKRAGFEVIHRRSKIGESSVKTKFRRGSTAILGAVAEALAWHVDHLVIHAWQPASAECIFQVLDYHSELEVTFVATSPSPHLRKLVEWLPDRVSIINPNDTRSELEYLDGDESQGQNDSGGESSAENGSSVVTSLEPEQGIHRARRIGRVSDFGNIHGWAKSIGCLWDGILELRRLLTWKPLGLNGVTGQAKSERDWSHWVVPMRDSASSIREAGLSSAEDAGWNVLTAPVIDEHALDDGVIGVAMARSSHLCDNVLLLSGDADFDAVMRFLARVHATNFFRLAPPPMEDPYNCTSVRVTKSDAAIFIPLDEVLGDLFHISNEHRPNHLRSEKRKHINQRNKNALRDFDIELDEIMERELQKIMRNIADRRLRR